jgi:hypothetical protein
MRTVWGPVTEIRDLGVVAEQCPYCERIVPCLLRSVCRGNYVLFLKTTAPIRESSCLCTVCLKAFPSEHWRYATFVPIRQAKDLPLEGLLARTNPGLAERLQLNEQISALGGDARFGVAYEHLEGMRPGPLRSRLLKQLLDWDRLTVEQRSLLGQQIGARASAWQFARQIAPAFPAHPGCLTAALAALVVCSMFLLVPAIHSWLWGSITVVAGCVAAALGAQVLRTRHVGQWTRKVLIPEAQDGNVSLACFLAVVEDVPGSRLGMLEELWPIKVEIETVRGVLIAEGKLEGDQHAATGDQ